MEPPKPRVMRILYVGASRAKTYDANVKNVQQYFQEQLDFASNEQKHGHLDVNFAGGVFVGVGRPPEAWILTEIKDYLDVGPRKVLFDPKQWGHYRDPIDAIIVEAPPSAAKTPVLKLAQRYVHRHFPTSKAADLHDALKDATEALSILWNYWDETVRELSKPNPDWRFKRVIQDTKLSLDQKGSDFSKRELLSKFIGEHEKNRDLCKTLLTARRKELEKLDKKEILESLERAVNYYEGPMWHWEDVKAALSGGKWSLDKWGRDFFKLLHPFGDDQGIQTRIVNDVWEWIVFYYLREYQKAGPWRNRIWWTQESIMDPWEEVPLYYETTNVNWPPLRMHELGRLSDVMYRYHPEIQLQALRSELNPEVKNYAEDRLHQKLSRKNAPPGEQKQYERSLVRVKGERLFAKSQMSPEDLKMADRPPVLPMRLVLSVIVPFIGAKAR